MAEVLEIEKVEAELKRDLPKPQKDNWILRLPPELCQREGFAEGTLIILVSEMAALNEQSRKLS